MELNIPSIQLFFESTVEKWQTVPQHMLQETQVVLS